MTENGFNREFRKRLQAVIKGHVWKVADKFSVGISDFIVFLNETETVFVESKRLPRGNSLAPHTLTLKVPSLLSAHQHAFLHARALQGFRAYVVVSFGDCPGGAMLFHVWSTGELVLDCDARDGGWQETARRIAERLEGQP